MKNKKGFTLVELLAVISILAILVLISMPAIMDMYRNARKDTFLNEVRNLLSGAESAFLSEALKNNKIQVVASKDELVEIANQNGQQKLSGEIDYTGKKIDYYIELDIHGKPQRYVFTDGNYAIFSTNGKEEVQASEIIEETINIEDYVKEFNIGGPVISTGNTYTREALDFDFKAKDLIGKGPGGTNLNTWTSKSGDVQGTIYQYKSGKVDPIINPEFTNNALVLRGRQAIRFNAGFNYDDTDPSNPDSYGSFTLEATVNFSQFAPGDGNYTNLISNIETGGYYLNVHSDKNKVSYKGKPGLSVYFEEENYEHCTMNNVINTGETHVIAGSFDLKQNKVELYLDGKHTQTCDYSNSWNFRYPEKDVPLSVGGNPSDEDGGYFTDREWVYGKIYTARIYQGVLDEEDIYMNYLSNYVYANNLSENSSVINLASVDETIAIEKYQYSLDGGKTWLDYDPNAVPLVTQDTLVSARTISKLGVISPVSTKWVYID